MNQITTITRKYLFNGKEFYLQLITIALPIIIQNLITSSLNMVDTVMIGQLGEVEIAAVGIANQYFFLFNLIIIGISSGCGVFIAQFWGQGDIKNIKKILVLGLLISITVSLLFTVLARFYPEQIMSIFNKNPQVIREGIIYLKEVSISYVFTAVSFCYMMASRSIGKTFFPMLVSGLALVCNTFLNYVLIFGYLGAPALGVKGAAIATVIARLIEMLVLLSLIYLRIDVLKACWRDLKELSAEYAGKAFRTILPVVLNDSCWGLGFVVYSVVYGRIGTQAFTAVQITNTVQNLFTVVVFGMASAAAVMVGHRIGEGKEEEGEVYAWRFSALSLICGLLLGIMLATTAPSILLVFKISTEVYNSALHIMYITALFMPIRVFCIVQIIGVLRGGGDVRFSFVAEAITMWCIGVPVAFLSAFVLCLPVEYVVTLVMLEELTKFIVIIVRLLSKQWIKNLVQGMEI